MLRYKQHLKNGARHLRKNMTDSERVLWSRLRGKQVFGVQVYRQKPLGEYIVDFVIPKAKLVIEVDGSQHSARENAEKDRKRDDYMKAVGLQIVRFKRSAVLKETDAVVDVIARTVRDRLNLCADPLMAKEDAGA
ncbi:MAG: endonuclease domain-containing protein [Desulfobacterales bacterium]|jgi:very-short-patch-repair endonuclease